MSNPTPAAQPKALPGVRPENVTAIEKSLMELAISAHSAVLNRADDFFFGMLERAKNNQEQRKVMDTMRILRQQGRALRERFQDALKVARKAQVAGSASFLEGGGEDGELCLVSTGSLDRQIATDRICKSIDTALGSQQWELEQTVKRWNTAHPEANFSRLVYDPTVVSQALRECVQGLLPEDKFALIVFKLYETHLVAPIVDAYRQIYQAFSSAGVAVRAGSAGVTKKASPVPPSPSPQPRVSNQRGASASAGAPTGSVDASHSTSDPWARHVAPEAAGGAPSGAVSGSGGGQGTGPASSSTSAFITPPEGWVQPSGAHGFTGSSAGFAEIPSAASMRALGGFTSSLSQPWAAGSASNPSVNNPALDAQLLRLLQSGEAGDWGATEATDYRNRMLAVGQVIDDLSSDALIPKSTREAFDDIRHVALRMAVADANVFEQKQHDLHAALEQLIELAVIARLNGKGLDASFVTDVASDLNGKLRGSLAAKPALDQRKVDAKNLDALLADDRFQLKTIRSNMWKRARALAREQMLLLLKGKKVPPELHMLSREVWLPVAAVHLANSGRSGVLWKRCVRVWADLIAICAGDVVYTISNHALVMRRLIRCCKKSGMKGDRLTQSTSQVARLLASISEKPTLMPAVDVADTPDDSSPHVPGECSQPPLPLVAEVAATSATGGPPPEQSIDELLDNVVDGGRWFRVSIDNTGTTRPLRAVQFYASKGVVIFADFNLKNRVTIPSEKFLIDLADGVSHPLDPSPQLESNCRDLRALVQTNDAALGAFPPLAAAA